MTINANDTQIPVGYPITLTWNSANSVSCVASGAWSGGKSVNGTYSESLTPASSDTFTITCTNGVGVSASAGVSVDVRQWTTALGQGNIGESCRQWLSRTGQAGIDNSSPRSVTISNGQIVEGQCAYNQYYEIDGDQGIYGWRCVADSQDVAIGSDDGVSQVGDTNPVSSCAGGNTTTQTRR